MPERTRARLVGPALVVAGLLLVVCGSVWWGLAAPARTPPQHRTLGSPPQGLVAGQVFAPAAAAAVVATPALTPGVPRRVVVPALGIDVPVLPVAAPGGDLTPPSDPFELGWWRDGPRPGAPGVALVTGHTVHDGPGALNALGRLRPGDLVTVDTSAASLTYRIAQVRTWSTAELARHAQEIFATSGPSRLALVTCSGWDGREYLSNTVVTAVPV